MGLILSEILGLIYPNDCMKPSVMLRNSYPWNTNYWYNKEGYIVDVYVECVNFRHPDFFYHSTNGPCRLKIMF